MKLLFVHDVKAVIYGDHVFARSYGYSIWKERYLNVFEKATILTRNYQADKDMMGKIDLLSGENIRYDDRIGMFKGPDIFFNRRAWNIVKEDVKKSDFVICRLDSFLGLMAIEVCRKSGKPYLIEVAGCAWDSFWNHGMAGKIIAPAMFIMTRRAIKKSKYVIYVTKSFLQSRYPTKGNQINVSNVKLYHNTANILQQRIEKISHTDFNQKIIIGTAANVDVKYKGQQYVIRALGILKKLGYNQFEYQLPGAGDNRFLLEEARKCGVEEDVVFLGSLTHEKMMEWYQTIDLYIQPSLQEGLPRSVIEAMSYALPCMGTNVAGIPELLEEDCLLDKKRIVNALVESLQLIRREKFIEEAKRNFEKAKLYDFDILNERRKKFFEAAIAEQCKE